MRRLFLRLWHWRDRELNRSKLSGLRTIEAALVLILKDQETRAPNLAALSTMVRLTLVRDNIAKLEARI